jgi:hypothetical protein
MSATSAGRLKDGGLNLVLKGRIATYLQDCGYMSETAKAAEKCSGHNGRIGMYTAAPEAGVAIDAVAPLVRHKSLNVALGRAWHSHRAKRRVVTVRNLLMRLRGFLRLGTCQQFPPAAIVKSQASGRIYDCAGARATFWHIDNDRDDDPAAFSRSRSARVPQNGDA